MNDPNGTPQGEPSGTPMDPEHATDEPVWASEVVDVPGLNRQMKLGDLVKAYPDMHKDASRYRTGEFEAEKKYTQLEEQIRPFQEAYYNNPEARAAIDAAVAGVPQYAQQQYTGQTPVGFDPRKTAELEAKLTAIEDQNALDRIRQKGHRLDEDMELEVLRARSRTGESIDAAYWRLFGEQLVNEARQTTRAKTADEIAANRNVYSAPKGGPPRTAPKKPVTEMTEDESRGGAMDALKKLGF